MRCLKTIILVMSLMVFVSVKAQRERNYIYLLDCTKSMTGYGGSPIIWEPTKAYLREELKKHVEGTSIHVIPFQDKTLACFSFYAEELDWKKIEDTLNGYVKDTTNTNICDAWDAIDKYIDPHKDNYIILLTDGKDNVKGMEAVAKKLSNWCGKYPNTYAFYVQLTEMAIDSGVAKVIDICDNEFVVNASKGIPVFGSFDKGLVIYANTLNLNKLHKLSFSSAGKYEGKAVCKDPYFDVKVVDGIIQDGTVSVQIVARKPVEQINAVIPQLYNFTFDILSSEVRIINPTVKVQMTNKPERSLEVLSEETNIGKATWYDKFLFWGASNPDTLSVDLKAVFNEAAKKDGASVELKIQDPDGGKDFQLFFNNKPIEKGTFVLKSNESASSVLSVVFYPNAKKGTRYLSVKARTKHELDKINDQPVGQYKLSLRSKYVVTWNPLKTILMWLGILILAALLLWFLLIKYLFYPPISVKTIQINDPYFSKVNVKGKRRVVFTNKKMEQGFLSRIFTGKILYKNNAIWTSPLAFEAGVRKKTLRVMRTKDYVFDPYSTTLKAPNNYVVENTNDNTKIKISIN